MRQALSFNLGFVLAENDVMLTLELLTALAAVIQISAAPDT
jgi:hydrogenase-4 membrane subunit HyfE